MTGEGLWLTFAKSTIKQLIMDRFDRCAQQNGVGGSPDETAPSNGQRDIDSASAAVPSPPPSSSPVKRQASSDATSEPASASPPAKKHKPDTDTDADAAFAAKLQAEENSRARPTRGGNTRRAAPVKKKSKAKTSKRVKAEDDSDIGSGDEPKKEVNRNTGFHVCLSVSSFHILPSILTRPQKPMNLSEPLSALLGELTVSTLPDSWLVGLCLFCTAFATTNRQKGLAVHSRERAPGP
jgi:upstream activation factor subunit UAF30